ncbi:MAG TPA: hypothetical protein VM755_14270 [Stellaceae bacterium]|nr:hypothetical protein [Stellaceae bacterium]
MRAARRLRSAAAGGLFWLSALAIASALGGCAPAAPQQDPYSQPQILRGNDGGGGGGGM